MSKLTCKECGVIAEPMVAAKIITCRDCKHPFDYFATNGYLNEQKKKKLAEERAAHNKKLVRGLKK